MKECARWKQYVEVVVTHCIDGSVQPQKILLANGPAFEIEESREAVNVQDSITGEPARRVVGSIWGTESFLAVASGRWFVEMKE